MGVKYYQLLELLTRVNQVVRALSYV